MAYKAPRSLRVFVVEDDMLVAMMLEDILHDGGHTVAGTAARQEQAVEMARDIDADVAILDIDLDGKPSFPAADILADRGIPYFFASGYGVRGLNERHAQAIALRKPFDPRLLLSTLWGVAATTGEAAEQQAASR